MIRHMLFPCGKKKKAEIMEMERGMSEKLGENRIDDKKRIDLKVEDAQSIKTEQSPSLD